MPQSVGDNPPSLVISLVPFPKHNGGAITDTTRFLITMKSIYIQANVIDHSYSSVTIPYVLALCPQYRLIQNIWIIRHQLHRMSGSNGVLHSLTSSFVNESKAGKALLILHSSAEPLVLVPVLKLIGGIRWSKNHLPISNGEREIRLGLTKESNSRLPRESRERGRARARVRVMMQKRMVMASLSFLMRNMAHMYRSRRCCWWRRRRLLVVEKTESFWFIMTSVIHVAHVCWLWWWWLLIVERAESFGPISGVMHVTHM